MLRAVPQFPAGARRQLRHLAALSEHPLADPCLGSNPLTTSGGVPGPSSPTNSGSEIMCTALPLVNGTNRCYPYRYS